MTDGMIPSHPVISGDRVGDRADMLPEAAPTGWVAMKTTGLPSLFHKPTQSASFLLQRQPCLPSGFTVGCHVLRPYHPISTLARTKCPDTPPVSLSLPALGLVICIQSYLCGIATPPDAKPSEIGWVGERTVQAKDRLWHLKDLVSNPGAALWWLRGQPTELSPCLP